MTIAKAIILQRVRGIVGDHVPIGAEIDPHCHITEAMIGNATALVAYKEYPHIDIPRPRRGRLSHHRRRRAGPRPGR